ncbi:hypothetical protein P43SY_010017 [Pythium insidiosum]|uniref:Uncharacterized protein n=1 Tax=Pythium insidiosum TaxID=114742 RepID=A0AAD5LT33_PYTIN|nr:hypothetical protein P43SY_010017 [Pythium insidiosum]
MASWAALNLAGNDREQHDGPDAALSADATTQEALEAHHAARYEHALRLQRQRGRQDDAKEVYTELLAHATVLSARLRYLCFKNLGQLEAERAAPEDAVTYFSEALALDDTDVLVWFHLGKAAVATGRLALARRALEAGLQLDATFWPLLHLLADVLEEIGDDAEFARIADYLQARDPHWSLARQRKRKSIVVDGSATAKRQRRDALERQRNEREAWRDRAPLEYLLQRQSWVSLGKLLLQAFEDVSSEARAQGAPMRRVVIRTEFSAVEPLTTVAADDNLDTAAGTEDAACVDLTGDEAKDDDDDAPTSQVNPDETTQHESYTSDHDSIEIPDAPTQRRKSRRHEERLREEHEAAVKRAREKNIEYQLLS